MSVQSKKLQMGSSGSFGGSGNSGSFSDSSEVFSTDLFTGTGANNTITNNVDLAGQGGLVVIKGRNNGGRAIFFDTVRGGDKLLACGNNPNGSSVSISENQGNATTHMNSFNSDGFTVGTDASNYNFNQLNTTYVAHTFRRARKFFDIRTYTGNGSTPQTIAHSLDCEVGMMWIKQRNASSDWIVYHRGTGVGGSVNPQGVFLRLNTDGSYVSDSGVWNNTAPTSTHFTVGTGSHDFYDANAGGGSYIVYLFAHDTDADSIIKCGSFQTNSNATTSNQYLENEFGFEPTYATFKPIDATYNWNILDEVREMGFGGGSYLHWNTNDSEVLNNWYQFAPTSKGFIINNKVTTEGQPFYNGKDYIYTVIKRTMPEIENVSGTLSGTSGATNVFFPSSPVTSTATQPSYTNNGLGTNLAPKVDMSLQYDWRGGATLARFNLYARLFGRDNMAVGHGIGIGYNGSNFSNYAWTNKNDSITHGYARNVAAWTGDQISFESWNWRRAKGFFDIVIYRGDGTANRAIDHNLGTAPKMMVVKAILDGASGTNDAYGYHYNLGTNKYFFFGQHHGGPTAPQGNMYTWANTSPTATQFSVSQAGVWNGTNYTNAIYAAFLFGETSGVTKMGSYTGTGTSAINIDCGFSSGIDAVIIQNISRAEHTYIFDRDRGIVTGQDKYYRVSGVNSAGLYIASQDVLDQTNSGFQIKPSGSYTNSNHNYNGDEYIFYAIAKTT